MKEELLKGLSEEQIAKVKACKNQEEILKVAKEEGLELNEEQLEAVSGGGCTDTHTTCPACSSSNVTASYRIHITVGDEDHYWECRCNSCGKTWKCSVESKDLREY